MPPEFPAHAGYVAAFREIAARVAASLAQLPPAALPIQMYVAGGAALHFHTGGRVSADVDAAFSRLIALPDGLDIAWRDDDGSARLLYFDRQYNDTFGLIHEDAYEDSIALALAGIDPRVLDVRILTPLDLAVSKLGRYSAQDRADIATLAERGLLDPVALENRALEAIGNYVGDTRRLRGNMTDAVKLVANRTRRSAAGQDPRHLQ
ncbi:MAG: hypothetical protein EPO25_17490 [Gammaproteobacteria bacterium]|nr:MAG: hypothetical protein EPO25_17490 [Gammaproteobacteria bacterium]